MYVIYLYLYNLKSEYHFNVYAGYITIRELKRKRAWERDSRKYQRESKLEVKCANNILSGVENVEMKKLVARSLV